jgi:hypothetical protein
MTIAQEYQAEKIGTLNGKGDIYQVAAPLHEQIKTFGDLGISFPFLIDPQEVVETRLAGLTDTWTRTSIMPVTTKGENTILVRPDLIITGPGLMEYISALQAVNSHKEGQYPTRPRDFYEIIKELAKSQSGLEPEDRIANRMETKGDHSLTSEMPDTRFILGRKTHDYYDKKVNGKSIPFYDLEGDSNNHTTVNYLWFYYPQDGSSLRCRCRSLDSHYGALGVLKTAEGGSREISEYSLTDVKNANSQALERYLHQKEMTGLTDKFAGFPKVVLEELR